MIHANAVTVALVSIMFFFAESSSQYTVNGAQVRDFLGGRTGKMLWTGGNINYVDFGEE